MLILFLPPLHPGWLTNHAPIPSFSPEFCARRPDGMALLLDQIKDSEKQNKTEQQNKQTKKNLPERWIDLFLSRNKFRSIDHVGEGKSLFLMPCTKTNDKVDIRVLCASPIVHGMVYFLRPLFCTFLGLLAYPVPNYVCHGRRGE